MICSKCKTKTKKYTELPVVESPKDQPHNEPFCLKCAEKMDYEPEYDPAEKEERLYQANQIK